MFLLDTNAISEPGRQRPNTGFQAWFDLTPESLQFFSVLTIGELRSGTQAMAAGHQRTQLEIIQALILTKYADQVLPVDLAVALRWAELSLENRKSGRTIGAVDELIAATAIVHDLTVVTRNVRHFEHSGCKLLSPWSG